MTMLPGLFYWHSGALCSVHNDTRGSPGRKKAFLYSRGARRPLLEPAGANFGGVALLPSPFPLKSAYACHCPSSTELEFGFWQSITPHSLLTLNGVLTLDSLFWIGLCPSWLTGSTPSVSDVNRLSLSSSSVIIIKRLLFAVCIL